MCSEYTEGLELLSRIQEQINEIKSDAESRGISIQKLYTLGQAWNSLKTALAATCEAAGKAVTVSKQQRARHRAYTARYMHSDELRVRQGNNCLAQFRYVTTLSHDARVVRHHHESALTYWTNLQAHYEGALDPQAAAVPAHQSDLDSLSHYIEDVKLHQRLEMIYIRWLQLRATANLARIGKNFHLIRERLDVREKRAEKAERRAHQLWKEAAQYVREYEHLKTEVAGVQRAIEALWDSGEKDGRDAAVGASGEDEIAEQMA